MTKKITSERGKMTYEDGEDTRFFRHPVRATAFHARRQGVNATVAAIVALITGTVVPMVTQHWQEQEEQRFKQNIYQRLGKAEQDIAVLKVQIQMVSGVTNGLPGHVALAKIGTGK